MSESALPESAPSNPQSEAQAPFKLLTRQDVAAIFSVSVRTIENWRAEGAIPPSVQIGGRVYWHPDTFIKAVNELCPPVTWETAHSAKSTKTFVSTGVRPPKGSVALSKSNARDERRIAKLMAD
ncbi:helix-turn-helix transcriptional regulator [Rhodoferax sediminis]|jgi:hypothetical protein|uniref:DNA-binding protein n=1 Tax=Rhodoferax sediminis TaxID=2509614 RepID=A0A515D878_9BURK|nr:helix-turn-helix domain-containing protein [Rhodoferax sediminis]QDL36608.1 DNA-binding protein [Rhodoferax sediminis]